MTLTSRLRALLPALAFALAGSAFGETVVRYGISMADIPLTSGQPDRGTVWYPLQAAATLVV